MLLVPIDARFFPGVLVITPGALEVFKRTGEEIQPFLTRHLCGDWGNLDTHDLKENEYSLRYSFRLLSAYALQDGTAIWVITEADRSATTILLPSEY